MFPHKPPKKWHTKYLQYPEMAGWNNNLLRRPKGATRADIYFRYLCRAVEGHLGKSPVDLLKMNQPELEDAVTHCLEQELKHNLGSTVENLKKAFASFLAYHLKETKRDNYIPGVEDHPNADGATIPEQHPLRRVLDNCDARTAVCLVIVAEGGQRLRVIGQIDAKNGLRLRDLTDLVITPKGVSFKSVPCQVEVSKELSKNTKAYFFFLGPEACERILAYLRLRLARGEVLTPDSPLVTPSRGPPRFMYRTNIATNISNAMQRAGVEGYPYLWRSYYSNRCGMVESKGFSKELREFFMGHACGIQARYGMRKKGLPGDYIESLRKSFEKALPFLESRTATEPEAAQDARRLLMQACGFTDEELNAMEEAGLTDEEWAQKARDGLTKRLQDTAPAPPAPARAAPAEPVQQVIPLAQVKRYLAHGWRFKATLGADEAVIEASPAVAAFAITSSSSSDVADVAT
jgi:hypothetical protein